MSLKRPAIGEVYTFKQIISELILRDQPFLRFYAHECMQVIQIDAGPELLELEHWADSRWEYQYETSEWIPLFRFAGDNTININQLVDIYDEPNPYREYSGIKHVVPKGTKYEPYYLLVTVESETRIGQRGNAEHTLANTYNIPEFNDLGERIR